MNLGIAIFLALPVLRVILMLRAYLRARDYRIAAVALLVLVMLGAGIALGLLAPSRPGPPGDDRGGRAPAIRGPAIERR